VPGSRASRFRRDRGPDDRCHHRLCARRASEAIGVTLWSTTKTMGNILSLGKFCTRIILAAMFFAPAAIAQDRNEMVLKNDVNLRASLGDSSISYFSTTRFDRKIVWNSCELQSKLRPRHARWFGSLGAYNPAFSFGGVKRECNGVSRAVVQEGQIHFDSEEFATEWIRRRPRSYNTVWLDNGLLVSWAVNPARSQFNVDIWLMCFNGRPYRASGKATTGTIEISPNKGGEALHDCATVGSEEIEQTKQQLKKFWQSVDSLPPHMRGG
jgi:hypothetical protein